MIAQLPNHPIMSPEYVAEGFQQLVENEELCGAVMRVTPQKGIEIVPNRRKDRNSSSKL